MTANDTPENVESMSVKKLPLVDIDRTLVDAIDGGPGSMHAPSAEVRAKSQEFFNNLLNEAHKLPSAEEKDSFGNMVTDDSHKFLSDADRKAIEIMVTDEAPKFPTGYREYLDNFFPVENNAESHYMYIFGDMPWSMDSSRKVPQGKIDEMMTAVAVERLRAGDWNPAIGRSDLVTHADISGPESEESVKAFEDAVRKALHSHSDGHVIFIEGDVISDENTEGEEKQ